MALKITQTVVRWDTRGLCAESKVKINHQRSKTPTKDVQKRNIERAILKAKEATVQLIS